jgi:hypothetical protein
MDPCTEDDKTRAQKKINRDLSAHSADTAARSGQQRLIPKAGAQKAAPTGFGSTAKAPSPQHAAAA